MVPYAFRILNNIILNFTKMLLFRTSEYYQLVLCEVSRLYVKKCLRKTPERKNVCEKSIMEETAFKERPYFVESYQVK